MAVETTDGPTIEQSTDRAWLLGKMQTSLLRDGWGVVDIDPEAGTLGIADARMTFTVSLSIPEREKPPTLPAKKSSPKRKR